ncbi:hypothetical protein B0H14DRAFT_2561521 [Mycena olivaceomarginata]|nr:hypothetical protein B0H14DRAFT_2561521 [Mycena olivaceomarginata]
MAKGILLAILQKKLATNRRKVQPARYQTELADKTQLEKFELISRLQIEDGGDETRNTQGMRDSGVDRITRDAAATQVMQPRGNLWLGHSGCVEGDFERFEVKTMLGKRLEYSESDARGTMLNVSDDVRSEIHGQDRAVSESMARHRRGRTHRHIDRYDPEVAEAQQRAERISRVPREGSRSGCTNAATFRSPTWSHCSEVKVRTKPEHSSVVTEP